MVSVGYNPVTLLMLIAVAVVAAVATVELTRRIRAYALRTSLLDHPNERSSHKVPTPRGGGMAIALVVGLGVLGGWLAGVVASGLACALLVGGALVAGIGWVDDRRGVSPVLRAIVHILAASIAVISLGGYPSLALGSYVVDLGLLGGVAAVLAIAYLVNVYNFMDGTDGLAGAEGGQVAAAGALLSLGFGGLDLALVAALISGSCFGFLVWNWPPARIFMGDVGSGLLGYWFGVLAIASEGRGVPSVAWIVLLGVFLVDGTLTLARRVLRGERWYEAHRSHLYQRAAAVEGHRGVVWAAIVANILLAMLAWLSVARTDANLLVVLSLTGMLIGYWVLARRYPLRTGG